MKRIIALVVVTVCILTVSFGLDAVGEFTYHEYTITVSDKNIKRHSDDDIYLIYSNEGTFAVEDSLFHGRFNSSDVYGSIKVDETYKIKTCGWRIPFLSMYENILEIEKV